MNMQKSRRASPTTIILFVLAVALLLFSTIGVALAALKIESKIFKTYIHTETLDIELSTDDVVSEFLGSDTKWAPGKAYKGSVSCSNEGTIPEYVRVTIFKYWIDPTTGEKVTGQFTNADGETLPALSPDKILLGIDTSKWTVDSSESSPECTVLYLKKVLPVGGSQEIFNSITIDSSIRQLVKQTVTINEDDSKTVTNEFIYHGMDFGIDVLVDSVQNHNAEDAMLSAWGKSAG